MPADDGVGRTIRNYLRSETSVEHTWLDERLGALVTGDVEDYAAFLAIQYRARKGIERWLEQHCIANAPPPQTGLIARDLRELGHPLPFDTPDFTPPASAQTLGVCWVLAGSALGNRAVLARLAKQAMSRPVAFLSGPRMGDYWRNMLPILERPAPPNERSSLLGGASAAFAHFNAVAAESLALEAV
ncbi:biliverdin-producing heme oxygenase [Qipengyuania mesophila]|uniref:biliverdin-producing heme oxygenase n=1 Tax=Qipengyuania mesophila TaxID=2867246 RepID=UPI00351934B5